MKKILIITIFLLTSFVCFSQITSKTIEVEVSTLKNIKKDNDKCKLVRVAYDSLLITNSDLVKYNLLFISKTEQLEKQTILLQSALDDSVKALRKKKSQWILPAVTAGLAGIVTGFIINN